MRHFAFALLITYIIMIINKSVHLGEAVSPGLCQFSGKPFMVESKSCFNYLNPIRSKNGIW